jgi:probable rRNA maturation factor
MIKINVITNDNNWLKYLKKPNLYLNKKIKKLNSKLREFKKNQIFFTILLSGNKEIKDLNKKFRKKNKTTDILSFPYHTKVELNKKLKTEKEIYLGYIIINIYKIKDKNIKKNFRIEFDRLWIHGLMHLFGYVHKKNKDFEKMNKIEKKYFNLVND